MAHDKGCFGQRCCTAVHTKKRHVAIAKTRETRGLSSTPVRGPEVPVGNSAFVVISTPVWQELRGGCSMVVKSVCSVGEETVDDGRNVGPDWFCGVFLLQALDGCTNDTR